MQTQRSRVKQTKKCIRPAKEHRIMQPKSGSLSHPEVSPSTCCHRYNFTVFLLDSLQHFLTHDADCLDELTKVHKL